MISGELATLGLLAAVGGMIVLLHFRPRAVDLVVCGLPLAGVVGSSLRLNLSAADLFLPFALLAMVGSKQRINDGGLRSRAWLLYGIATSIAMLVGLLVRSLMNEPIALPYGIAAVVKIWICFAYLLVFAHYGRRAFSGDGEHLLRLWARVSFVAALAGIAGVALQRAGVVTSLVLDYRARGGFDDPNLYASYLLIGISITFVAQARGLLKHPILMVTTMAAAILLSGSRAAVPALVVGVLATLVFGWRNDSIRQLARWSAASMGLILLAYWFAPNLLGLDSIKRLAESSESVEGDIRLTLWRVAWEMWLDNPLIGVGIGQYIPASVDYFPGGVIRIPHSSHLSLLAETGVLGYVLILGLPIAVTLRLVRRVTGPEGVAASWLLLGLIGTLALAATLNLENSRILWAFVGLCLGFCATAARRKPKSVPAGKRPVMSAADQS